VPAGKLLYRKGAICSRKMGAQIRFKPREIQFFAAAYLRRLVLKSRLILKVSHVFCRCYRYVKNSRSVMCG
jgi:hypothetical protein